MTTVRRISLGLAALTLGLLVTPRETLAARGFHLYPAEQEAESPDLLNSWRHGSRTIAATVYGEEDPDIARERLVTFLNRWQSVNNAMGVSVLVHVPRLEEGAALWSMGDHERGFFLMTSGIDLMVKGIERILPVLQTLEPPEEVAAPVQRDVRGTELFFDGLKRINWGLVRKDDRILRDAFRDYYLGLRMMSDAYEEVKAIAAEFGVTQDEETGVWQ